MGRVEREYRRPRQIDEALELLAEPGSAPVAGGTDLLVRVRQTLERPARLVDVSNLPELLGSGIKDGAFLIGAAENLDAVSRHPEIGRLFPVLRRAALDVASPQVRNVATVGGNLCQGVRCWFLNQSSDWQEARPPCFKRGGDRCYVSPRSARCRALHLSDMAAALVALRATAVVAGAKGERRLDLAHLYTNDALRPLALQPGELLVHLELPLPAAGTASAYVKIRRSPIDFALLGVASEVTVRDGRVQAASATLIGAGAGPQALPAVGEALAGGSWAPERLSFAGEQATRGLTFLAHMGVPGSYRRAIAGRIVARSLAAAGPAGAAG